MRFFNLDLHIAVIADIKDIFAELGHEVVSWDISGHSWVFDRARTQVDVVNEKTWENLDQAMCDAFYNRYKEELRNYDGFIAAYPPAFSMLYEKFKKPIITVAATRYEFPFSRRPDLWSKFNKHIQLNIDQGKLIAVSNNKYDAEYCKLFTEREWEHIPSLCGYTGAKYTSTRDSFLYSSKLPAQWDPSQSILPFPTHRYEWQEIADHKGIIHIPYNASIMSIFEQYNAGIPLFFPTWDFLKVLHREYYRSGVLSELSWSQVRYHQGGYGLRSALPVDNARDPNNFTDTDSIMEWVKLADFYDQENLPHIQYFNSPPHLNELLNTVDFKKISKNMRDHTIIRRKRIHAQWSNLLDRIKW
jgi:hypothetical protein